MPERDATLDAFISQETATSSDAEREDPESDAEGRPAEADADERTAEGDDERTAEAPAPESAATGATESEEADAPDDHSVEPAVTTLTWSPDGDTCDSCGSAAERRWRTDSGFVCGSCVDWERTPNQ